jgi:hypothetical protein
MYDILIIEIYGKKNYVKPILNSEAFVHVNILQLATISQQFLNVTKVRTI